MKLTREMFQCDECEREIHCDEAPVGWIAIVGAAPKEIAAVRTTNFEIYYGGGGFFTKLAEINERLDFCSRKCLKDWAESKWRNAIDKKEE